MSTAAIRTRHLKPLLSLRPNPSHHFHSAPHVYDQNLHLRRLVRSGDIHTVRYLFDQMSHKDAVSFNTMIAAYWSHNLPHLARSLFLSMPSRTVVSYNCMLAGHIASGDIETALAFFRHMPIRNVASWNALLSGLVRVGMLEEAERVFEEMPERNVISYTAMVDGLVRGGEVERARALFERMTERNVVSWVVMISGYVENGKMEEARRLFEDMPRKSAVAITAMMTGYCNEGDLESARRLFEGLRFKDLVSWNVMIAGYTHNLCGEEALNLHIRMMKAGMKPDHTTLIVVVVACSIVTSLQSGKQIHAIAVKNRLDSVTSLCNALMTMYNKCGSIDNSKLLFEDIPDHNIISWNTIIAAYAQHGHYEKVLTTFYELLEDGLKPDGITFLSVLSVCGHVGMVDESLQWFCLMVDEYKILPLTEHFSCLVDILGRAGKLEKAYQLILSMPSKEDSAVWSALLGACRVYLNVELGELAAIKIWALDPQNSAAYVMLSNIYAAAGMWSDVTRVRLLMKERGVKKERGYSWIEIGNKLQLFTGGDVSHPDISKIHAELRRIFQHMHKRDCDDSLVLYL